MMMLMNQRKRRKKNENISHDLFQGVFFLNVRKQEGTETVMDQNERAQPKEAAVTQLQQIGPCGSTYFFKFSGNI